MGMLDDAFRKEEPSPTRKRMQTKALVPFGKGRRKFKSDLPWLTPPPKQSTSLTVYSPKRVAVRRPPVKSKPRDVFDFNDPFGSPSQPLGSSSGIKAGKRHKGMTVGGIRTPSRGGGIKGAVGKAVGKTKRGFGVVGRPIGKAIDVAEPHFIRAIGGGMTKEQKRKERASIGKQAKKGIHRALFRGRKKLI